MKLTFRSLITALYILGPCAAAQVSAAQISAAAQESTPAFDLITSYVYWGSFVLDDTPHVSNTQFGASRWECMNFATTKNLSVVNPFSDMRCGYDLESVATIRNLSPLAHRVDRIATYVNVYNSKFAKEYLQAVRLRYGSKPDLSDAVVAEQSAYFASSTPYEFVIESPERMRYYSLELVCGEQPEFNEKEGMCYVGLGSVNFYAIPDDCPVAWEITNHDSHYCNVMSESGRLHMIYYELDGDGNVVYDSSETENTSHRTGAIDWSDTSWTAPLCARWETVSVNLPRSTGHRMVIRAKSEYDTGGFSPESVYYYSADGLTSSVESPVADNMTDTPVYYTLQGSRVDNPSGGIYIRVCGAKAEKTLIR